MKNLLMKKLAMFRYAFAVLLLIGTSAMAWGQNQISGVVKDASTDEVIPGVNVVVKGTTDGTITDIDGKYTIKAPSDAVLVFSFIGYTTVEEAVAGRKSISVALKSDTELIDEIVAVGYGFQRKSDLTGSVASVRADDLKNRSTSDAAAALQGKAAGVQILNTSGKPGQGASIRVRGYSSNSDKIGPLLIVDGLQVSSIQYLDPELIESMEVLKDAASAAIYGAEAGNGVVLITTKNGNKSNGKITYSGKWSLQSLGKVPELLNASEFIDWMKMSLGSETVESDMATYKAQFGWDPKTNTNWLDEYFEDTWAQQHSLSFSGGNANGNYFLNLSYVNQNGIVKGDKDIYERFTAQVNADYKIKDWLQVGTNTSIEKWRSKGVSEQGYGTSFEMLLCIDPLTPVYWTKPEQMLPEYKGYYEDANSKYVLYGDANGMYATSYFNQRLAGGNPFSQRDRAYGKNDGVNINGTIFANLTPTKWLTFTSRMGYRLSFGNSSDYSTPYYLNSQTKGENYSISSQSDNSIFYQWENFLNINHTFAELHNLNVMLGMSFRQNNSNYTRASASGPDILSAYSSNFIYINCVNGNDDTSKGIGGIPGKSTSLSYFGRLGYTFDSRYSVQVNFRSDAFDSSKLSADKRWGQFPSVSLGWTLSNESFIKDSIDPSILSFAKIRGSWGRNGNVNVLSNYSYTAGIATNGQWYQYNNNNVGSYGSMPNGLANPNLTWETSEQIDLGLDLRFLNDRLTLGLDWYKKTTKDLLVPAATLPESGASEMTMNAGEIENKGFEAELTWKDKAGDFSYSISGNMATLKNEVTYLEPTIARIGGATVDGSNLTTQCYFEEGMPVWYMRGFKYKGRAADGSPLYYDKDGKETANPGDDDRQNIGQGIPKVTFGVTLNAEYKGIDLSVFGTGVAGNDIYYGMYRTGYNNIAKHFYDEAKAGNMPDPMKVAGDMYYWSSSACVFSGAFFKIKQIQLGYTLPKSLTEKAFMQNVRCYVSLDDFITITKYPGLDPETCSRGHNGLGIDSGAYPNMRKLVLGLNVTF